VHKDSVIYVDLKNETELIFENVNPVEDIQAVL
jgi:hypothetical protein